MRRRATRCRVSFHKLTTTRFSKKPARRSVLNISKIFTVTLSANMWRKSGWNSGGHGADTEGLVGRSMGGTWRGDIFPTSGGAHGED